MPRVAPRPAHRLKRPRSKQPSELPRHISRLRRSLPGQSELEQIADRLQGLAHPSKLKAILALQDEELCVSDLADVVGLSLSATSTLLRQLRQLGFLSAEHAGKQTYYRIADPRPAAILRLLRQEKDAKLRQNARSRAK